MPDNQDIALKIRVLDAQGKFRGGTVDVELKHRTLSDRVVRKGLDASGEITFAGLRRAPTGDYQVTVTPTDVFKPQSQFVNIPASGFATMTVTIDRVRDPQPQPETLFEVKGTVRTSDGAPLASALVRAFHEAAPPVVLGENRTDERGNYAIRYSPKAVPGAVSLRVSVIGENAGPSQSSAIIREPKPLEVIDLTLPPVKRATRVVEGRVVLELGLPAEKLRLRLYRHGFGGVRTALGETTTGADGKYVLPYEADGKAISLEIRAVDAAGKETPLSRIMHGSGGEEKKQVDLVAPEKLQPVAAEFQRLASDLWPHVGEMKELIKVREDAERQDLTLLNRATGWDARLIALAANASKLSADPAVGLSQEVLYGLFRAGLPSDKLQLAQVGAQAFEQALTKVRVAGIVSLSDAQAVEAKKRFETFATETRLAMAVPGSRATYGDMLKSAGLGDAARTKFASIFLNQHGAPEKLWEKAAQAGLAPSDIQTLRRQGKLAFLTLNNPMLMTRLQKDLSISDPVQLVRQDFYRADRWAAQVRVAAGNDPQKLNELIPPLYTGEKVEDRLSAYANDMARKVRLSYPTQVVGRMVELDAANGFRLGAARTSTATLLNNAAQKGFRIGAMPVEKFVRTNPDVINSIAQNNREAAVQSAKTLQMVYQISPSDESMSVLFKLGLTSAYDVAATSREVFLDRYAQFFPTMQEAELVYRKARQVTSVTYNLFAIAKTLESQPPVYGLSGPPEERDAARNELIKQFPTLESLFGSMDFCECEHCRSVLSPAAYLVDLLQFLDPERQVWDNFKLEWKSKHHDQQYPFKPPYEVLTERRPDIPYISLTCENTHTALPYIDVVNEILEYYVAHNNTLEAEAARDTGEAATEDLLAQPQNVNAEAYGTLLRARYPIGLPFDLWLETAREFADYFETPLWRVLEALRPGDNLFAPAQPYDRAAVFVESLGLSPSEYAIFTDPDPLPRWFELYGYATAAAATTVAVDADTKQRIDLNSAKALSRRLGVTYKELAEIVRTGFVNPKLAELGVLRKLGVSVQDVFFYRDNRGLLAQDPNTLTRENYSRLQEVSAFEQRLDGLTAALQIPGFDAKAWMNNALANNAFNNILVLADPDTGCNFDLTTLRYAGGAAADPIAFLKINLFVRLWRKLGWSIEETDRALQAFVPAAPFEAAQLNKRPLRSALIYMAHLKRLDELLGTGKDSRLKLLTLWSPLATTGNRSLYAQLFLSPGMLKTDAVFDDQLGNYLSPAGLAALAQARRYEVNRENVAPADRIDQAAFAAHPKISFSYDPLLNVQRLTYQGVLTDADKATLTTLSPSPALAPLLAEVQARGKEFTLVKGHLTALQGALGLTADEIGRILADAGEDLTTAPLSLDNVSLLYRYRLLARALKLSARELIALKQLSGLDPFKALRADRLASLAEDFPFTQTLRFVEVAGQVKESGLKVEDLEYLLRHSFDETGKYRSDGDAVTALLKTLSEGIRAIRAEHDPPEDPGGMSEETLRQKLGLVLPPEVVELFFAMMNGTAELTATKTSVPSSDQLQPAAFADEPSIRQLSYNPMSQAQKLTFRGVLFSPQKDDLKARLPRPTPPGPHVPSELFAKLLDDVEAQAHAFFEKYLQKQAPGVQPSTGFLEAADFDLLFAPEPAGQTEAQRQTRLRQQRTRLAQTFLPFLQRRLIRQFIIETMTAKTGADPALVESLLSDKRLLGDSVVAGTRQPLLEAFAATGKPGLTASFFASANGAGDALTTSTFADADTGLKDRQGNPLKPAGTNSARFSGYMEVPAPGLYRFFVKFGKRDAEAELRFEHREHLPGPFLQGVAAADGAEIGDAPDKFLELKPGRLYRFSFDARNLGGGDAQLLVQGESLAKGSLARLRLYPEAVIKRADRAWSLLRKVLQLIQTLSLSEREVRHLLTHPADFGGLDLSLLPTSASEDTPARARALFGQFLRLAGYARLKRDLADGTDDLVAIFETPAGEQAYALLAKLLRRETATVKATAKILFTDPGFTNELAVQRLWEALQVVERFGVPVTTVVNWTRIVGAATTPDQRFAIARDLKEAIKARFDAEAWRRVAQPIFDKLRRRQRNALVAHVVHQKRFASAEQLYEYFLIDPGMEPVVQTSRIRLAISSVQLFVQRCLLNLEPQVHPSAINSDQWEWMKRYRVWEANRKIFLFPENFLDPEFRDDKTHLFGELEGALLQGDVSADLVEDAFLTYLKKLDEMAHLDILGMHLEDNPDPALRTLHVIGSTFGEPRKYFYRRYAHQMWTPWEPISAQVEGRHLAPVVWRDRLYLFWVTFMEKGEATDVQPLDPAKALTLPTLESEMEAQLHWSEYVKGEWHTPESSELSPPAGGRKVSAILARPLDPRRVHIYVVKEPYENGEERGVFINLTWPFDQAFYLAGRNSVPESKPRGLASGIPYGMQEAADATRLLCSGELTVTFARSTTTDANSLEVKRETATILQEGGSYTLLPCDNDITLGNSEVARLVKPFFYQDNASTLFVEPTVTEHTIEEWQNWVVAIPVEPTEPAWELPEIVLIPERPWRRPIPIDPDDPFRQPTFSEDSLVQVRGGLDWLINPATGLMFGGELIGPGGRAPINVLPANEASVVATAGGTLLNLLAGDGSAPVSAVITAGHGGLEREGLTLAGGALNVVGSAGLSAGMFQNLNRSFASGGTL